MKRSMFVLFALCGLLWPSTGHSQEDSTPGTDPNLRLRHALDNTGGNRDTVFVDWSTAYAKPQNAESPIATGTPAVAYQLRIGLRIEDSAMDNQSLFSLTLDKTSTNLVYDDQYAQVRRDTLLLSLLEDGEYTAYLLAHFGDGNEYTEWKPLRWYVGAYEEAFVTLSVDPAFVREDAGATTIEIKAQLPVGTTLSRDFHVTLSPRSNTAAINALYYLDAPPIVIPRGESSATGQITITPIPNDVAGHPRFVAQEDEDLIIELVGPGILDLGIRPEYIRLLDDDRPTTEIELTVSDPAISIDGRATDVTVTGTLNGALLDESVSFQLGVMPLTTAGRDTDFGIRLARLTVPAGQATGTATVRVTPQNQNGGQIWLGVAEHPTIGTGSNRRTIVVKEAAIELTRRPSGVIANIEVLPTRSVREDAGQVNVDLKVVLKDALPVDETVRFEIVEECDQSITGCFSGWDVARRGTDYFAELSPLAIPAGQKEATATLSLEIVDNPDANNRRALWVVATLGNSRHAVYILIADDESDVSWDSWVELLVSPTEIAEDSGQTTVTVTGILFGPVLSQSLTFTLGSAGEVAGANTATRDVDYAADFEPLTIPAGQATGTATLTITPTPNDGQEQDEVIRIAPVGQIKINQNDDFGLFGQIKITENGQERELLIISRADITLKDVADQPATATQTEEATSSLAFDAPASTVLSGTVGEALSQVLPTAQSDPEGALTYRVFNLPDGLTFDVTTRTITGTPTVAGETSIEYYVLDEGVSAVLTYTIDIQEKPVVIVELGGIAANPLSVREDADEAATVTLTVSLRKAAKEDAVITLAIVGPTEGKTAKLNEDFTATLPTTITIPAGKTKGTAEITLLPKDNTTADGNKALAVQATSPSGHQAQIDIQIIDNETASTTASADDDSTTPDSDEDDSQAEDGGQAEEGSQAEDGGEDSEDTFAVASTVDDQAYTEGTEIPALVLPEATGGEGEVSYRVLGLPAGLAFDAATRTISGTPTAATDGAVEVTYLAQDSAEVGITLTFSITVNPALSFGDLFDLFGGGGG